MEDMFGSAIILAGGQSSRMGYDKQLIEIQGIRLMKKMVDSLSTVFKEIIVVTNKPELYLDFNVKTVSDEFVGKGPLAGFHAGLKGSHYSYSYITACDMPNIELSYIEILKLRIAKSQKEAILVTEDGDWIQPFNGFYSKNIVDLLEAHLKEERTSLNKFIKKLNCEIISSDVFEKSNYEFIFNNINTQEELDEYLKTIKME